MGSMVRGVVIFLAAGAVALAAYNYASDDSGGTNGKPVSISFVYSSNLDELVSPLIERFNDEKHAWAGRRIEVVGEGVSSGEAEAKIAAKSSKPTIWTPASSLWARLLNHETDAQWAPDESPALVRTPLVIALWKPEAEALGWRRKPLGFAQILELATNKRGWAEYGLPTFGAFKLGHTNPDFSTSGLAFVTAQYYTATGKLEGLTIADVRSPSVRKQVQEVQRSIVHYGDTGSFFVDQLMKHGPGYVSAVAMEEVTLLDYNRGRPKRSLPLVALYPAEGTFYFDNPLITLRAPWVSSAQRRSAAVFERWLAAQVTPQLAATYGYRPGNPKRRAVAPIDRAHLVDPAQPRVVLGPPEPEVLAAIKHEWHEDRKPANVAVVVDVSGSMQDEDKLLEAQEGLRIFLRQFSPRDRVGLLTFSDRVETIVPVDTMQTNGARLVSAVDALVPSGGTAVYDATAEGVRVIDALGDTTRINAVVVLTDGEDNESRLGADALVSRLRAESENQERNIRVFTIAYGKSANKDILDRIADASGGKGYAGDPTEIASVYRQISSFF